jgi:alcohol dehydrogenase class IV
MPRFRRSTLGQRKPEFVVQPFTYDALEGRVVFGDGAFERLPDELDRLGAHRVLLIADRSGRSWAESLVGWIGDRVVGQIGDVRPHVPVDDAENARRLARSVRADAIVTIGGGSATGLGKAVALEVPIPILAVPTTYAGSEMTPIWGLTSGARKETGRDSVVQPRTVVYDPILTLGLPPSISGPSGMNALAHCAEALYAEGANPITSLMAEQGIRILARGLPIVVADPGDLVGRGDVLGGAYLAGAAFAAAGSGIHHKICHVLGGAYDLPHAEMHSVVLPHALAHVAPAQPGAIGRMAAALGHPDVPGAVFDLGRTIGAPAGLADIGMPAERLDEAAGLIAEATDGTQLEITPHDVRALLGDAFAGRRPEVRPAAVRSAIA